MNTKLIDFYQNASPTSHPDADCYILGSTTRDFSVGKVKNNDELGMMNAELNYSSLKNND